MNFELVSKFPATTRDVTYVMDPNIMVNEVLNILIQNKPKVCETIQLCGYFEQESSINISFRMTYQEPTRSLEMAEVNSIHKAFAEEVIHKLPCRFP